jgi:hypothetical protein
MEDAAGQSAPRLSGVIWDGVGPDPRVHAWELHLNEEFDSRWSSLAGALSHYLAMHRGVEGRVFNIESRREYLLPDEERNACIMGRALGGSI